MYVVKRDGHKEPMMFDKITARIKKLCYGLNDLVDPVKVAVRVIEGLYDGVAFHRVIAGFMAQTGDVEFGNKSNFKANLAGSGSSTYDDLKAEFSDISFEKGVVGMARSRYIHSANSQFFIMTDAQTGLNGQYTVIGRVVAGMDVVNRIKQGSSAQNGKVVDPDFIKEAVILP